MAEKKVQSDITFSDCLESVRYEVEDALERFPEKRDVFLHQVRLLVDSLQQGTEPNSPPGPPTSPRLQLDLQQPSSV